MRPSLFVCALSVWAAACGGDSEGGVDADVPAPDAGPICGNGLLEGDEECDDGNILDGDFCSSACRSACGDGTVQDFEACDTAIPAGDPGACPTTCDDTNVCTTDQGSGEGCQAQCFHGDITAPVNGDGCCPVGANINSDDDCPAGCGNGVVEPGETCDTAIPAGQAGECPTSCDDGQACTGDALQVPAACQNACVFTEITAPFDGDGCCPAGATDATDMDCPAGCGDGAIGPGETCDTAIPAGTAGACPAAADCDDLDGCTVDSLLSAGTCVAACNHEPITALADGDGCCPAVGNANIDTDCAPVCGNGVLEAGEGCDDGGTAAGDGCDPVCQFEPTAFRIDHMEVRDPHIYLDSNCADITGVANFLLNDSVENDNDDPPDGYLDLNIVNVFRPLDQGASDTPFEVDLGALCTAPMASTMCESDGAGVVPSVAHNLTTGTCLDVLPGTTNASYSPAITLPAAPCFSSDGETLNVNLGTATVLLVDAYTSGTYVGVPATQLIDGLIRGFISEVEADATILDPTLPLVGGKALSQLLTGGAMSACTNPDGTVDLDVGPDGVTPGWWFYVNFTATVAPYTVTP